MNQQVRTSPTTLASSE